MSATLRAQRVAAKPQLVAMSKTSPARSRLAITIIIGIVLIQLAQLVLQVVTSQGAYEMANLKSQRHDLTTSSDILSAQVDSLASNQNLANAAQSLGMIPNSSPVFLQLSDDTIIGKPKAAYFDSNHQVSRNLVPNAAMTTRSHWQTVSAVSVADVATEQNATAQVTLTTGNLPVSPTH